jgi:DnaJ-class molecular chaperone
MDYYETLGVNHTTDVKSIKNAYRKLASRHHPDKGGDPEQFKKVQEAWDVLGDPQKKQEYDNPSPYSQFQQGQGQPFDINDIFGGGSPFGDIFGQRRQQQQRQPMYRTTIQVSLKQAYTGSSQAIEINTAQGKKVITLQIPKGVQSGQQMRVENAIPRGTLVVDFFVQQDFNFDVRGNNLFSVHSVSVLDLVVGTTFDFKTISDKTLRVTIQPGTQPDQQIKLTGQGMPTPNSGRYGDQIILLKPYIPATIEKEIVDAIKKYKDIQDLKSNK